MTTSSRRSPRHLSDTALIVLGRAADSENQMLMPIPKTVRARGKALERTLQSLLRQGFVEEVAVGLADEAWRSDHDGRFGLRITRAELKAIGVPALMRGEAWPGTAVPTTTPQQKPPRPGSKLAQLITMLMQPDGRSIDELSEALGWQVHTTRAVIRRLQKSGHVVVRTKNYAGVSCTTSRRWRMPDSMLPVAPGSAWLVGLGVSMFVCYAISGRWVHRGRPLDRAQAGH